MMARRPIRARTAASRRPGRNPAGTYTAKIIPRSIGGQYFAEMRDPQGNYTESHDFSSPDYAKAWVQSFYQGLHGAYTVLPKLQWKANKQRWGHYSTSFKQKRENPRGSKGKFSRCVKAVSKRGGAVNPRAVCGAMEKKYRGNPTRKEALEQADPYAAGRAYAQMANANRYNPDRHAFLAFVRAWSKKHSPKNQQWITAKEAEQRIAVGFRDAFAPGGHRGNPAAGAISAYEEFHGRKPDEFVKITRTVHSHRHLSGAGELRKMKVKAVDGKSMVTLSRFGKALLAFNEAKNQLFIEGGNQSVDLQAFGIRTQHEVETLGKVTMLDYFTRKDHLGDEGGTAVYRHKFRTVNEDGRPVTVKILRYPDLIYFVRDEHLVFSGGDYEILAEGIDK